MDYAKITGVVRHVISGIGAGLIGFGLTNADTVAQSLTQFDSVIGGIVFLVGVGMSIIAKVKGDKADAAK